MFHLPHGEMGITLQDIDVMLRIPMDGLLVTRKTDMNQTLLCRELLGNQPLPSIPNLNTSILVGARIRYKWLDAQFTATPAEMPVMKQFSNMLATTYLFGWGPVVHGQVSKPGLTPTSAVPQPNQQCQTVQLGQCSIDLALQAPLQCIEEGCDVDWSSTVIDVAVGLFKVPISMPNYEAAFIASALRTPCHYVHSLSSHYSS